jgi:hypothetical protein
MASVKTDPVSMDFADAGRVVWNGCITPDVDKKTGKPKYNLKMLFPKTGTAFPKLKAEATKCKNMAFGEGAKISKENIPWTDGDEKYAEDPEKFAAYKGMVAVNFHSNFMPPIWGPGANPARPTEPEIIVDPSKPETIAANAHKFTNGCYARVVFNCYSSNFEGMNKRVSFGFSGVQKIRDAGPDEPKVYAGAGMLTAAQAGFTPAAANDPASYAAPASGDDEAW